MLNSITIARRTELRRVRALALLALITVAVTGCTMFTLGLWCHCIPVAVLAPLALPLARIARNRVRCTSRVLRMLGA